MKCLTAILFFVSSYAFAQEVATSKVNIPAPEVAPATTPSPTPAATPTPTASPIGNTATGPVAAPTAVPDASPAPLAVMSTTVPKSEKEFPRFSFQSYGYFSFSQGETFKTVQDTNAYVRRQMDLAAIAFEGTYTLTSTSKIEFEVELEHGGTGVSMEYDPFEEFGEFENSEIEKGGEVVVPEFVYKKTFTKTDTLLKVGKFPMFIALGTILEKPHRYASVLVSDVEARMIPSEWNEMGVQAEQKLPWSFTGRLGLVSGLNSEFFRTYNWIGGGYQRQFENINADDLATTASLEWGAITKGTGIALAYYNGNTTDNRYKKDKLTVDSYVTLWSLMANYKLGRFGIMGEMIDGTLENSDKVQRANAGLGGTAKPMAFSPLGHKARLDSLQVSYDFSDDFVFYVKQEHVDTFSDVEGSIAKNPRYNLTSKGLGLMWNFDTGSFMKAQYMRQITDLPGLPETYQASLAVGFDIAKFD